MLGPEVVATMQSCRYNTSRRGKGSFTVLPEIRLGEGIVLKK